LARVFARRLLIATLLTLVAFVAVPAAAYGDPTPPPESFSFYMSTVNQSDLYNLGLTFGEDVASGTYPQLTLVVLDWGSPYCTGSGSGSCGTYIFTSSGTYEGTASERAAAEQFGEGFWVGTGGDTSAHTYLAMGTNNYGSWVGNSTNAYNHGQAWSNMVNDGNTWLSSNGYSSQVSMRGGTDSELDWNGPTPTNDWAKGYESTWRAYFWDYGDAAGCPPFGGCDNGWNQRDVWLQSYGYAPAEPLPEIYNEGQAEEWGNLANYAYEVQSSLMSFLGPMSQHQACADLSSPCTGEDNTPDESWTDLYNALNCSTCDDAQTPPHVTNIRWKLSENMGA